MLNTLVSIGLKFAFVRLVLDRLKVREMANRILRSFPLHRSLPRTGFRYRVSSVDALLVMREIFSAQAYAGILPLTDVTHFADLGCNCGYFTCFLMDALGRRDLSGILIDANPRMVAEAEWHAGANGFDSVSAICGVVGAETNAESVEFFLHPDDAGSSQFASLPPGRITHDRWEKIEVPRLSLAQEWRSRFGDRSCDLLKIDIEGSEQRLLWDEADFVASARTVVIEIHRWLVDVGSVDQRLTDLGFKMTALLDSGPEADVRLYQKVAAAQPAAAFA